MSQEILIKNLRDQIALNFNQNEANNVARVNQYLENREKHSILAQLDFKKKLLSEKLKQIEIMKGLKGTDVLTSDDITLINRFDEVSGQPIIKPSREV